MIGRKKGEMRTDTKRGQRERTRRANESKETNEGGQKRSAEPYVCCFHIGLSRCLSSKKSWFLLLLYRMNILPDPYLNDIIWEIVHKDIMEDVQCELLECTRKIHWGIDWMGSKCYKRSEIVRNRITKEWIICIPSIVPWLKAKYVCVSNCRTVEYEL
jgi:hypothetical protein